jgi:tetratricopeptide (TPR) repeat protein
VIAAFLALALLQQSRGPDIMVAVDRDRVAPGEVVAFTVRVSSASTDPIRVDLPSLGGFELEARSERSDVTTGPALGRTTVIELHLRATTPGQWRIGPVNVRQGSTLAQSETVTIRIEGGSPAPVTASLNPRVARLVQRAPPPGALGQAGISVALSDSVVSVGQQVDVVTIAWFDREVRQRLRRAPTVESPRLEGVWSYPQPVPGGIAASREVSGRWYDLFVLHQVAFPLTPGRVGISPARLQFSVPLAFQFFSQEERYKLESQAARFTVRPLPDAGRPPDFVGAVGLGLTLGQTVTPGSGRQGEAFSADVAVRGEGNVALWPQPDVRWPAGVRVYPEAAEEQVHIKEGRLAGAKVFHFLVLADSAGTLSLPPLRYTYFDPSTDRYEVATAPGLMLVVAPRSEGGGSRAEPPPVRLDSRRPLARMLRESLPDPVWVFLLLLPGLSLLLRRLPRSRPPAAVNGLRSSDPLGEAERRLDEALRALLPGRKEREDGALALALSHAGVEPALADELAGLRDRLRAARFAPAGPGAADALRRAVLAAVGRLGDPATPGVRRWRRKAALGTGAVLLALGGAPLSSLAAQAPPEQLYEAGAYRAAEDAFRRRAELEPEVPTHWLNLGDAAYRAGDDAAALAAWTRGARLAPRDAGLRRALLLLPPADLTAARWLWIAPITPEELWLIGAVAWLAGWGGVWWTRRLRGRWLVLLAGGVVFLGAGASLERWYQRPVAVITGNSVLRLSPHELAPAVGEVPALGTVRIEAERGPWYRVRAPGGQVGWIRNGAVAPVSRPGTS